MEFRKYKTQEEINEERAEMEAMKTLVSEWMDYFDVWMIEIREGSTAQKALSLLESFA